MQFKNPPHEDEIALTRLLIHRMPQSAPFELPADILQAESMPSLPLVAMDVIAMAGRDDVDIEELSEVIARDPGLAVKMLKLANSPLFNMDGEVSTIRAAS
ncbi:MAG: HD-like signal output (HDOD) protein, partial [Planctomycetota bacterium]